MEKAVNMSWIRQYDQVKKRSQPPGDDRHDSEEPQVVKKDGRVFLPCEISKQVGII